MFFENKCNESSRSLLLSKIHTNDINALHLDLSTGNIVNSECAALFHKKLNQKYGLDAVASYLYGTKLTEYTRIIIWLGDGNQSKKILQNQQYCQIYNKDKWFTEICECMLEAVKSFSNESYKELYELYVKEQKRESGDFYLSITIIDFKKQYQSKLFGVTGKQINDLLKKKFSIYNFDYVTYAVDCKQYVCNFPLILFYAPDDLTLIKNTDVLEQMTEIIKDVISKEDKLGLFEKGEFVPQVCSKRDLSVQQVENIYGIISLLNEGKFYSYWP